MDEMQSVSDGEREEVGDRDPGYLFVAFKEESLRFRWPMVPCWLVHVNSPLFNLHSALVSSVIPSKSAKKKEKKMPVHEFQAAPTCCGRDQMV
jgi:hypothetical protein